MYCTRVVAAQVRVWWYYAVPLNHTNKTHPSRAMQPPKLLDQVRTVLRVKHFSLSTERAYVNWIKRFILFHHKRHPREMGELEIRQFVSYLAVEKKISASTQTVALSALLFLYRHVLKQDLSFIRDIERAKPAKRLPVVFTRSEVQPCMKMISGRGLVASSFRVRWNKNIRRRRHNGLGNTYFLRTDSLWIRVPESSAVITCILIVCKQP